MTVGKKYGKSCTHEKNIEQRLKRLMKITVFIFEVEMIFFEKSNRNNEGINLVWENNRLFKSHDLIHKVLVRQVGCKNNNK